MWIFFFFTFFILYAVYWFTSLFKYFTGNLTVFLMLKFDPEVLLFVCCITHNLCCCFSVCAVCSLFKNVLFTFSTGTQVHSPLHTEGLILSIHWSQGSRPPSSWCSNWHFWGIQKIKTAELTCCSIWGEVDKGCICLGVLQRITATLVKVTFWCF